VVVDSKQAAIVAQIAITRLSLNSLNQTHWFAQASFVVSLTLALMAVYYASTQQRILGRLLQAKQVRLWIRGGKREFENEMIVPSLDQVLEHFSHKYFSGRVLRRNSPIPMATLYPSNPREFLQRLRHNTEIRYPQTKWSKAFTMFFGLPFDNRPSDPDEYLPETTSPSATLKAAVLRQCFTPSVASVITISAPQGLLSGSLGALFIGVGIYFGFLWTKGLEENSRRSDSRNVFITYIVALGISVLVYSISQLFQDDDKWSEGKILEDYLKEYVESHPDTVQWWGVTSQVEAGELLFAPIVPLQPTPP
jgi:hypothetical protein